MEKRTIKRILFIFFFCCVLLLFIDLFVDRSEAHFPWEEWIGFEAVYGFVGCVLLVLVSKYLLRPMVMRDEDYYE
jgi:hypothetical protein